MTTSRHMMGVLLLAASLGGWALSAVPAGAIILGGPGTGAPQSEACKSAGGTESGTFCVLPNGDKCDSMTLARDNKCMTEDGTIIEEEDFGTNDGTDGTISDDASSDDTGTDGDTGTGDTGDGGTDTQ